MNTFFRLGMIYIFALTLAACASNMRDASNAGQKQAALHSHSQDIHGWHVSPTMHGDTFVLHCASNTACEIQIISTDGNLSTMTYPHATPLKDTGQVQYAYEYAREHRNHPSATSTDRQVLKALEPLFKQANVEFKHCLDLDPNLPKYMVACKLTSSPWVEPTVILFATQLSDNCGAFCRFTLLPLHEFKTKLNKSLAN